MYDNDDSVIKEYSTLVAAEGVDSMLTPLEDYLGTKAVEDMLQHIPELNEKNPPSTESSFLPQPNGHAPKPMLQERMISKDSPEKPMLPIFISVTH